MTGVDRPLAGITVVEFGHSVAAPYAGLILADLGARVIKVENPAGGDYARSWPPFTENRSTAFLALNRGKSSITVDFGDPEQVSTLRTLILREADAVIQNLRAGALERFGLTAEILRADRPDLIWCDIGAFGATGPLADKPGYDPLVQASTGIMSVTGEAGRDPVRVGVSLVDMGAGMWTVIGLLAGLIGRSRGKSTEAIATSLFETGLAWMTVPLAGFHGAGEVRLPHGSGIAEMVPYQAFETADGWLMIAAGNDGLFRKLCAALDLPELASHPDYATNPARVENRDRLVPLIAAAVRRWSSDSVGALLDEAGVPNAPVLRVDEVATHPQTRALGIAQSCPGDGIELVGIPISLNGRRPRAPAAPPELGADNNMLDDLRLRDPLHAD
jgi:crotonobetainyl-CoA:carnitine CoA-transferase CaiB-like acyl-CoA transferase